MGKKQDNKGSDAESKKELPTLADARPLDPVEMAKVAAQVEPGVELPPTAASSNIPDPAQEPAAPPAPEEPPTKKSKPDLGALPKEDPVRPGLPEYRVMKTKHKVQMRGFSHTLSEGRIIQEAAYGRETIESLLAQGVELQLLSPKSENAPEA